MAQFNKKTAYTAFGLLAIGAVAFVYTEPETPTKKAKAPRTTTKSAAKADGSQITEEDLKAKFPRVGSAARDAFKPAVTTGKGPGALAKLNQPVRPIILPPPPVKPVEGITALSVWSLTGISIVDGVRTALIENKGSGDATFLKPGSLWKGLRVASITTDTLVFVEPSGKLRPITFPAPPEEKVAAVRGQEPAAPGMEQPPAAPRTRRARGGNGTLNVAGESGPATENGAQP